MQLVKQGQKRIQPRWTWRRLKKITGGWREDVGSVEFTTIERFAFVGLGKCAGDCERWRPHRERDFFEKQEKRRRHSISPTTRRGSEEMPEYGGVSPIRSNNNNYNNNNNASYNSSSHNSSQSGGNNKNSNEGGRWRSRVGVLVDEIDVFNAFDVARVKSYDGGVGESKGQCDDQITSF